MGSGPGKCPVNGDQFGPQGAQPALPSKVLAWLSLNQLGAGLTSWPGLQTRNPCLICRSCESLPGKRGGPCV